MPIESGLILPGTLTLREVCQPLAAELSRCFWVISIQAGPFDARWLFASAENELLAERQFWDVPAFEDTATFGVRPGSLPQLADHLNRDEFSFYFAIDAPDEQAMRRATSLRRRIGDFSETFLQTLDVRADLFMCIADGWWELYCGRRDWTDRFISAWPQIRR